MVGPATRSDSDENLRGTKLDVGESGSNAGTGAAIAGTMAPRRSTSRKVIFGLLPGLSPSTRTISMAGRPLRALSAGGTCASSIGA